MNSTEFYRLYAERYGVTYSQAEEMYRRVTELLDECFDNMGVNDRIMFQKFGTFVKRKTAQKEVINPRTKERMIVPEGTKIVFTRSKPPRQHK